MNLPLVTALICCGLVSTPAAMAHAGNEAVATARARLSTAGSYADLVALFREWRSFEHPPLNDGAPDYSKEARAAAWLSLSVYQARLSALRV